MKKIYQICCFAVLMQIVAAGCTDGETYAEMKEKEKSAIKSFLKGGNEMLDKAVKVISEKEFEQAGYVTDTAENEFVLFDQTGIYMQIHNKGEGKSMVEMAREDKKDSTVTKNILCRYLEYDIESAGIASYNIYSSQSATPDEMMCTYNLRGKSYTASFTTGQMYNTYGSSVVPTGWLKPLDYVNLGRNTGNLAEVKLIVPHSSGTSNAANYVLPMFYQISYQLGK